MTDDPSPPRVLSTVRTGFERWIATLPLRIRSIVRRDAVERELRAEMAVGATPFSIVRLVVGRGLVLGVAGALLGMAGSVAASRVIAGQIFGVSPADPMTLAGTALGLVLVASLASLVPALRAARIDPVRSLRGD